MSAVMLAAYGAAGLAMVGAIFGVVVARMVWADDLEHARRIDEIRSRTEQHLRATIMSLEKQIAIINGESRK